MCQENSTGSFLSFLSFVIVFLSAISSLQGELMVTGGNGKVNSSVLYRGHLRECLN